MKRQKGSGRPDAGGAGKRAGGGVGRPAGGPAGIARGQPARACGRRLKPAERAHRALIRTIGSLRQVMEPYFARLGISGPRWAVLVNLHRAELEPGGERGLRLCDLSERLLIRPPSVTGVVDRLEREGLVARSKGRDDRRVRRVRLTPGGRAVIGRVLSVHPAQIAAIMGGLTARQQATLGRLLDRLDAHLKELNADAGGSTRLTAGGARRAEGLTER